MPKRIPFPSDLLPPANGLRLDNATIVDRTLTLTLCTTAPETLCPACCRPSSAVHSQYTRSVADVPWGGYAVRLFLHVRKFFCRTEACRRHIFTERLPTVVAPYARTTIRLHETLRLLAFALGGEAGARLSARLGMITSPATLIALIRHTPASSRPTPTVLGVDDWAKRKGVHYGTILVDLEAHRVVDLLPNRSAEALADWLRQHPGVTMISRDRGEQYATGGKRGAPAAIHVADRWHLMRNWVDVMERVLPRHQPALRQVQLVKPLPAGTTATTLLPAKSVNRRRTYADERRERVARARFEQWTTIRERHANGATLKDIARELRVHYKTVLKYAHATECPHMKAYPSRPKLVTPYEPYLRARWAEGCRNGKQLYREIQAHGFTGSRVLVSMVVAQWRREEGRSLPWLPKIARQQPLTPRDSINLIVRRPLERSQEDNTALEHMRTVHGDIAHLIELSEQYVAMIRNRQRDQFDRWMMAAAASPLKEVRQFARNVRNDEAAIRAALAYEWSQGQVEGQLNRLKLVKRSMYGRANFDLLRLRVLHAT